MTEQELNALVATVASIEAGASSGPWTYSPERRTIEGPSGVPIAIGIGSSSDGHLVALTRNALVALLGALQVARMERAEAASRGDRLQERNSRLTEKVQAWCPHLSTSGYITGDERCEECGLVDPYGEAGDR
ncbi:hypothetical protein P9990_17685 [Prescottella equi]|uniref:hypothetical protein n=1 Tax=Rhodococcus hoagii TaxID=43767 RepID=UPI00257596F0|nr:hypothetical protein [Prescottella equi]WJJ10404.1 hypothetical protein P9990_17685 [Prescottella equi]